MSIFQKNPNEAAYAGGKKHWADMIKNSGPGNMLIWKQPEEDFNTNSVVNVDPGEQAIFINGGIIEQVFDNGRYVLSTENYPFISRLRNAFTGGISTFNCKVYFVRTARSIEITWGTKNPLIVYDDEIAQSVKIKAFGSYNVKVVNPAIFLTNLVGNNVDFLKPQELEHYFDAQFQQHIVHYIVQTLEDKDTMIFKVISKLKDFSDAIAPHINAILEEKGLTLEAFSVMSMVPNDDVLDEYNKLNRESLWEEKRKKSEARGIELLAEGERAAKVKLAEGDRDATILQAQGSRGAMDILGPDWEKQQAVNILGTVASNPGSGGMVAAGAGLGMGIGAGSIFGTMAQQVFTPMQQQTAPPATPQPSGRFTQASAAAPAAPQPAGGSADDPVARLKQLKEMLDLGLIEQAEFDAKKAEIMSRM